MGVEVQFYKMERIMEMEGGDSCMPLWIYLIPRECMLTVVTMSWPYSTPPSPLLSQRRDHQTSHQHPTQTAFAEVFVTPAQLSPPLTASQWRLVAAVAHCLREMSLPLASQHHSLLSSVSSSASLSLFCSFLLVSLTSGCCRYSP